MSRRTGILAERAGEGRGHGDAGRGAVLGNGAFRHVQVNVDVAVELAREAERLRLAADVGERGLRRLLHHVAELAGDGELAFAVEHLHFSSEDAAADFGPRQAGDQADFALFVRFGVAELGHAEKFADVLRGDFFLVLRAAFDDLAGDLAADVADFALEVADAGFARVVADDFEDGVVFEDDVLVAQAGLLALLLDQILACAISSFSCSV